MTDHYLTLCFSLTFGFYDFLSGMRSTVATVSSCTLISTLSSSIKSCIAQKDLHRGKLLHAHITKSGHLTNNSISNHLLNMYTKLAGAYASYNDAQKLFDEMPSQNLVSFSILISAHTKSGNSKLALSLVSEIRRLGIVPNQFVLSGTIVACSQMKVMDYGQQVHAQVVVLGFEYDAFVKSSLIDMYSKFRELDSAVLAFSRGASEDPAVINSMLSGYVASDCYTEAIRLFAKARSCFAFLPTEPSFIHLIKSCMHLDRKIGESVHGFIVKMGWDSNCYIGTSLIDMYGRFGDTENMELAFDCIDSVDIAAYNALLVGFSHNGLCEVTLWYIRELMLKGHTPNECTFSSALKVCGASKSFRSGRILHGFVEKSKFRQHLVVKSALINMYMKYGKIDQSLTVFDHIERKNTIIYNSVISGLGTNEMVNEAFGLFVDMKYCDLKPDLATFITLIGLSSGREWIIYVDAIKHGFGHNHMFENALLDSLLKNGSSEEAFQFFYDMKDRDVVSWTSTISGLSQLGFHAKAIEVFQMMKCSPVSPNNFTLSSALKACGNSSSLQQGRYIHAYSIKHGILDDKFTKNSLLDMYAKCGALKDSHRLFDEMPKTDVVSWNTMISGYSQHGYGRKAVEQYKIMEMYDVEPNSATFISLLSACSRCGLVQDGVRLFELMILKHKFIPSVEHYGCMVDMFGRAGMLATAKYFIEKMPVITDSSVWTVFLSACKLHGSLELAQLAEGHIMGMTAKDAPAFVLMSNMYSGAGKWKDAEEMRKRIEAEGLVKQTGISWLQVMNGSSQSE